MRSSRCDGVGFDGAALDLGHRVGGLVAQEVDLAADEIVHGRAGAAIGNLGDLHAEDRLDQHVAQVRAGAGAGTAHRHLLLVGANVVQRFLDVVGSETLLAVEDERAAVDEADAGKCFGRFVGELGIERRAGCKRQMVDHQRVAVRLGLGDASRTGRAAGTERIFDDDGLAQGVAHRLADQPRDGVRGAAGGVGHDQGDLAGRIVLRAGGADKHQRRSECNNGTAEKRQHRSPLK